MKFDFAKFPAKVAELNRLHKQVRNLSDLRWKSGKEEDIVRWEKAVGDWRAFSGFGYPGDKFYLFENEDFLAELSSGESEVKKMAVKFLEFDPYYYRSGYIKAKLLVRLKNIKLSDTEAERLRQVVCNAIVSRQPKSEFKYYARLLKNIGTPEFFRRLQNLAVPEIPYIKSRLECCLQPVYWQ